MFVKRLEVAERSLRNSLPLPLQSSESWYNIKGGNASAKEPFKNCTPFKACQTDINDVFVDEADYFYVAMRKYNLT